MIPKPTAMLLSSFFWKDCEDYSPATVLRKAIGGQYWPVAAGHGLWGDDLGRVCRKQIAILR
jgi:hypothetical protein